ncbi:ankyrin repeat-containing domain protein, partial [Chytridium lagenaria]
AAGYGWIDICKLLIEYGGASLNSLNSWKCTPFMIANLKGHLRIMNYLLDLPGLEVNFLDNTGLSPLHTLDPVQLVNDLATLLIQHGADMNLKNSSGFTPLGVALAKGNFLLAKILI